MSTLTISGDGKWILIQEIDEETAEKYAELGAISEEIFEEFEDESEGYESGFFESADVYIDDKHIGTVEEIIELGKNSDSYKRLQKGFLAPEMRMVQNALVEDRYERGTFIETEIPDYPDVNGKLSPDFIKDFIANIYVATGGLYEMGNWNGEEWEGGECDGKDTYLKDTELYLLFKGNQHECIVDDETFLGDEDE